MKLNLKRGLYITTIIIVSTCFALILVAVAKAATETLSVVNISTPDKPGYAIYWPRDKGNAKLERAENDGAFTIIAETALNYYADFSVKKGSKYTYRVSCGGIILVATSSDTQGGKPEISSIKIDSGTATKAEASVIVEFKTDRLARSQVLYGMGTNYENQTQIGEDLNQSHTVLIEKLKPNTTYHFKIRATDKLGKESTESEDQTIVTPTAPPDQSLLEIIIRALTQAFSGFEKWLKS